MTDIKEDLVERAREAAKNRGLTVEIRKMPRRRDEAYHFRFAGEHGFRGSYLGKLVEDVTAAADQVLTDQKVLKQKREQGLKQAQAFAEQKQALLEKFNARFCYDEKDSISIGPVNLQLEQVQTDKVSIYVQQDLTWDEFEELILTLNKC